MNNFVKWLFKVPHVHTWKFVGIDSYFLSNDFECTTCDETCWFYQEQTPPKFKKIKEDSIND